MDNDIEVEKKDNEESFALNNALQELGMGSKEDSENVEDQQSSAMQEDAVEEQNNLVSQEEVEVYSTPNTESEVMLFLGEELEPLRRTKRVNVYDLETEYAKTSKNKLWSVWIMLGLTLAVVILVTVFTVGGLSASNEHINVSFSSFKDLDLQNLFNQLQRTQESFDEATKRHAELKGALDTRLANAKARFDNDIRLVKNSRLSRAAQKARTDKIHATYNAEVSAAHKEIDADLAAAEAEVKQYEKQLKSYDSESVAQAQKWEQQMDSERQIYQLEKKRLIESYEAQLEAARQTLEATKKKDFEDRLAATNEVTRRYEAEIAKYDPMIKDSKTIGLISDLDEVTFKRFDAESLIDGDANISEEFAYALREVQVDYDNLEFLYGHSASIPNHNTMKSVVSSEQKLSAVLANKLAAAAISELKEKSLTVANANQQLKNVENQRDYAKNAGLAYVEILNKVPVDEKIVGFVLDPNANYGVAVFIRNGYSQNIKQDGSTRVEIYDGKTKVATGAILAVSGNYYISLDNDADKPKVSIGSMFRISGKK